MLLKFNTDYSCVFFSDLLSQIKQSKPGVKIPLTYYLSRLEQNFLLAGTRFWGRKFLMCIKVFVTRISPQGKIPQLKRCVENTK
jgi:hypothetical protein